MQPYCMQAAYTFLNNINLVYKQHAYCSLNVFMVSLTEVILTRRDFLITPQAMLPLLFESCNDLVSKWEGMLSSDGSCEIDAWPFLKDLASDVISRSAFGSSFEEGKRIFQLQREQANLALQAMLKIQIPGWR